MEQETQEAPKPKARAPKQAPGATLTPAARERLEADAAIIPTTPEEQLRYERARETLKKAQPRVEATVARVPPGCATVHISGDDLADAPPGGQSRKYAVGDKVWLTPAAAEALSARGLVRL